MNERGHVRATAKPPKDGSSDNGVASPPFHPSRTSGSSLVSKSAQESCSSKVGSLFLQPSNGFIIAEQRKGPQGQALHARRLRRAKSATRCGGPVSLNGAPPCTAARQASRNPCSHTSRAHRRKAAAFSRFDDAIELSALGGAARRHVLLATRRLYSELRGNRSFHCPRCRDEVPGQR